MQVIESHRYRGAPVELPIQSLWAWTPGLMGGSTVAWNEECRPFGHSLTSRDQLRHKSLTWTLPTTDLLIFYW